jgi:hypothetical protein
MGRPIRLDVSEDDSILLVAPKTQKGEIMVIDVLNSRTQTLLLDDAYASDPRGRLLGRCDLGLWMVFVDGFVDEKGKEKGMGQLHVAWRDLSA